MCRVSSDLVRPKVGIGKGRDGTEFVTIEAPHRDGWWIFAVFLVVAGDLQLAELRLFPADGLDEDQYAFDDGEWSRTEAGLVGSTQAPLTARLLREVRLNDLRAQAQVGVNEFLPRVGKAAFQKIVAALAEDRRGRGRRADTDYVAVAVRYVELLAKSSRSPVVALANELELRPTQVRDLIHEARVRGLLTPGRRGKAGGSLTDKALRMLQPKGK